MTRVAVLADVHGNMPALEATLDDIAEQDVDEVLVGGDLVGRGPEGSRVVARIRELGWRAVRGNHEEYLLTFRRGRVPPDWLEADEWSASRWMAADLTEEDVVFIDALPFTLTSHREPRLRLVHGSPGSNNEGIGPWTSEDRLAIHLASIREPILVCAHTHRPLLHRAGERMVVNVGSVGLPFNGDRRAQYAIFDCFDDSIEVDFRRIDYDHLRILEIYESSGFLRHGGVTARLLYMELKHARPYLVPFLQWCEALNMVPAESNIAEFCDFYDPHDSLRVYFERLRELSRSPENG